MTVSRFLIRNAALRHLLVITACALLVLVFGAIHQQWSPMHRWNRATADASIMLLSITMTIGPMARLWSFWTRLLPFRRELGIYAILLAVIHTVIILAGWVEWDLARLAGFEFHPGLQQYVMVQHGFALANLLGLMALVYGLVLLGTSNDRAVSLLSGSVWKFVQQGAYVLWALTVVHTAYFLFVHFLDFHRPTPPPNPLRWPFLALVMLVLVLRCMASVRTWNAKRSRPGSSGNLAGRKGMTA